MDVTLPWPPRALPGVCVITGSPTRLGVVLRPRGADAELVVPLSSGARRRWRAVGRIRLVALAMSLACAAGAFIAPWALAGAIMAGGFALASWIWLRAVSPRLNVSGGALRVRGVHPRFAAAAVSVPVRCGGGCRSCATCG